MSTDNYQPSGVRFYDKAGHRKMMLVYDDEPQEELRGWLLYLHPDGQWVTLRKATEDDHQRITDSIVEGHHTEAMISPPSGAAG